MRTNSPIQFRTDGRPALELRAGAARVLIDADRGGRLASWTIGERELLVGPPDPGDRSIRWGCFLMAPWPGRLADGRFAWAGGTVQLSRRYGRHAIHGLLWDRPWQVESADADRALLSIALGPAGWPMGGRVRHHVELGADRLVLRAEVEADERMPAAVGWHPWFRRDGEVRLRVAGEATLATHRMLPTGKVEPVVGRTDLRAGARLGRRRLDHAYVDAASPAVLSWPDLELAIEFAPAPGTVQVYTPPGAVCVEPQTAWPNALAAPAGAWDRAGVSMLEAGEILRAQMAMTTRRRRAPGSHHELTAVALRG
jgi:galactose mutarotase-like enzyme